MKKKRSNPIKAQRKPTPTAWEPFGAWYSELVGGKGHYYHQKIVLPGVLRLLQLKAGDSVLDLACGQGVLSRVIPPGVTYLGVDAAPHLINEAIAQSRKPGIDFLTADITESLRLEGRLFSHAAIILALHDIERVDFALHNAGRSLKDWGRLVIVLNHPCFRIPRQTSWGVDTGNKTQFRRISAYLSPMKVPLQVHPSQGKESPLMWAFHRPISYYFGSLAKAGFAVRAFEEWVSDKTSVGPAAKMENRARKEFPLFAALDCIKLPGGLRL